eukprot:SAG11_NODE_794_length_7137_cov_45.288576_4_plen_263_part_00
MDFEFCVHTKSACSNDLISETSPIASLQCERHASAPRMPHAPWPEQSPSHHITTRTFAPPVLPSLRHWLPSLRHWLPSLRHWVRVAPLAPRGDGDSSGGGAELSQRSLALGPVKVRIVGVELLPGTHYLLTTRALKDQTRLLCATEGSGWRWGRGWRGGGVAGGSHRSAQGGGGEKRLAAREQGAEARQLGTDGGLLRRLRACALQSLGFNGMDAESDGPALCRLTRSLWGALVAFTVDVQASRSTCTPRSTGGDGGSASDV